MDDMSFKVYLTHLDGNDQEVRRFVVQGGVSNLQSLAAKLKEIFPSLQGKQFNIFWKDADEDLVTISTDEELILALTELNSHVKKLYVHVHKEEVGPVHPGVVCDGCEKDLIGVRYKCCECLDYDLCHSCEAAGVHNEHLMLRISQPRIITPRMGPQVLRNIMRYSSAQCCQDRNESDSECRYKNKHYKGHKKMKRFSSESESNEECEMKRKRKEEKHHNHHHRHNHHNHRRGEPLLPHYLLSCAQRATSAALNAASAAAAAVTPTDQQEPEQAKYLKSVGQMISDILNPFGVQVDYEVKSNEEPSQKKANETVGTGEMKVNDEGAKKGVKFQDEVGKLSQQMEQQKLSDQNTQEPGWTLLNDVQISAETAQAANVYPTLPPQQPPPPLHPNPIIADALAKMLAMGFTNDGGWLVQLLEAKNGDIYKALDILQPASKK